MLSFGRLVRLAREVRGYSIEELSVQSGISKEKIALIETTELNPSANDCDKLIQLFNLSPEMAEEFRSAATATPANASEVSVISSQYGGVSPWAQTIYSTELKSEGPRRSVQGYLSALVRPIELTLKQYEWEGVANEDITAISDILSKRRFHWQQTVASYSSRDIYPLYWIEKYCRERQWFGHTLTKDEVAGHLAEVENALVSFPNYEVALLPGQEIYFNFIIQGGVVLVEGGYEIEPEPAYREVSGFRITKVSIVEAFEREFMRLWNTTPEVYRDKSSVIDWIRKERLQLLNA